MTPAACLTIDLEPNLFRTTCSLKYSNPLDLILVLYILTIQESGSHPWLPSASFISVQLSS